MNRYLSLLILILLPGAISAQIFPELGGQRAGISSHTFLKNDISPRSAAMGGVNLSMTGDGYAAFVNPALATDFRETSFTASNRILFNGLNQSFFSSIFNIQERGRGNVTVNHFWTEPKQKRTEFQPNGTGEYYTVSNTSIGIGYSRQFSDAFSAGGNFKYLNESLAEYTSSTVGIDVGFRYITDYRELTFGVIVANYGANSVLMGDEVSSDFNRSGVTLDDNPINLLYAFGLSALLLDQDIHKIRGGIQLTHPNDNSESLHFGIEYSFRERFHGRLGQIINKDGLVYPSFGFGIDQAIGSNTLRLDYGASPANSFGVATGLTIPDAGYSLAFQHTIGLTLRLNTQNRVEQASETDVNSNTNSDTENE